MGWFQRSETYNVAFSSLGDHQVMMRVKDGISTSETVTAIIHVVEEMPTTELDLGLVNASAARDGDELTLSWTDIPEAAQYVYVKYEGYPMGIVEAANASLIVEDNDFAEDFVVSLAYMDAEYNMGEFVDLTISDLADGAGQGEIEPVDTGVTWAGLWEAFGLLLALAIALWCYVFS